MLEINSKSLKEINKINPQQAVGVFHNSNYSTRFVGSLYR
jgi:hypothetical protein